MLVHVTRIGIQNLAPWLRRLLISLRLELLLIIAVLFILRDRAAGFGVARLRLAGIFLGCQSVWLLLVVHCAVGILLIAGLLSLWLLLLGLLVLLVVLGRVVACVVLLVRRRLFSRRNLVLALLVAVVAGLLLSILVDITVGRGFGLGPRIVLVTRLLVVLLRKLRLLLRLLRHRRLLLRRYHLLLLGLRLRLVGMRRQVLRGRGLIILLLFRYLVRVHPQLLQVLGLPLQPLLLLPLGNIFIQSFSILLDAKLLIVIQSDPDWLLANDFVFR